MIYTMMSMNARTLLSAFGKDIETNGDVQNLENGLRREKLVFSENQDGSRGQPYSPQVFPVGTWKVLSVEAVDPAHDPSGYEVPWFIRTDAHQLVDTYQEMITDHIWYGPKTGLQVMDWGYGLHYSTYPYTLGCIRVVKLEDLQWLAAEIQKIMAGGDEVRLAVGQVPPTAVREMKEV